MPAEANEGKGKEWTTTNDRICESSRVSGGEETGNLEVTMMWMVWFADLGPIT